MISFATLTKERIVIPAPNGKFVAVERGYFEACHRAEIARVLFDEAFYLARYTDVAAAVAAGTIDSGQAHYLGGGYYEHRMPYDIQTDPAWYIDANPDVAEAVQRGVFDSAQDHFNQKGYAEGRLPYPGFVLQTIELPAIGPGEQA